ncbi:MAG: glycine C-acetyltransferase [Brevinema sp.]
MSHNFLDAKVQELRDSGVFRKLKVIESPNDALEIIGGKEVINLCSNNYLGFANHPRLKKAAIAAIEKYGVGAGAVRTINGNSLLHEELDRRLAIFKGEESVHHFQSGLNCNMGAIAALVDDGDLIISDELNHASIIDGSRLSKAARKVFRHADMNHLEEVLKAERSKYKNVVVISDGVFSMDGDIVKLKDFVSISKKYDALTYIDDAHGSGVLGKHGRGTIDHFNMHGQVDLIVGTLSKAIGVIGGYIAGSHSLYDWINHRARPVLFSTALPPSCCAAIIEAVTILEESGEYSERLWSNARFFQRRLKEEGFDIGGTETPITPIIVGAEDKAMETAKLLFENGVYASAIVFPTVPRGTGRIRAMVNAAHTEEQLERAVQAFKKVRDQIKF